MAEKLTFTNVQLLGFSRSPKSGKAKFSSSLTSGVIKKLEWGEIQEFVTGANLDGELAATSIELLPKESELQRHQIQLDTSRVYKFQSVRLELDNSKGKGHKTELRFTVAFADPKGARKLEEYSQTCGKSSLIVSYEKQAVQESLIPDVQASDEQRQAAMEIN